MAQYPNNPYQPSVQPGPMVTKPGGSSRKASAAGIALMIVGGLNILLVLLDLVLGMAMDPNARIEQFEGNEQMQEIMKQAASAGPVGRIIGALIALALSGVVCFGGYMMSKLTNYGFAMAAAIIAIIPCTGYMDCCCLIEVGIGIWALVVLMQADVKAMFS